MTGKIHTRDTFILRVCLQAQIFGWAPNEKGRPHAADGPLQVWCIQDQIGSGKADPFLKGPVATFGGATPEQTGLPNLSRRCDR